MLNLNVGIFGHVDSGKTSLAKVLSSVASTAAFDKNPQSQTRGITLDLGFSSLTIPCPKHLEDLLEVETIQFTLVDCPGHASLIKTVIGGAQIIDMILLVIDVTKGIQTQTAECILIGEITCKKMIIVLNKIDLLHSNKQQHFIDKRIKHIKTVLSKTVFKDSPFVAVSANSENGQSIQIDELIKKMSEFAFIPNRNCDGPFLIFVDHCFAIKGQGTVMTGTVLQGSVQVNDMVEIPSLNLSRKIKSIQMYRKPVQQARQGDRIGICVTQFDPKLLERGIICQSNMTIMANAVIISANKINHFKMPIKNNAKFHITIGYETVLATISCFTIRKELFSNVIFNYDLEYEYCDELISEEDDSKKLTHKFLLLEFAKPVLTVPNCLVIGSKLDLDINSNICRLAFWGNSLEIIKDKNYKANCLPKIKIFKNKKKEGIVERLVDEKTVIVRNIFKKGTNMELFLGLKVQLSSGELGTIECQFGQKGKVKVYIPNGLSSASLENLKNRSKNSKDRNLELIKVTLNFKKYIYDTHKKIIQ